MKDTQSNQPEILVELAKSKFNFLIKISFIYTYFF